MLAIYKNCKLIKVTDYRYQAVGYCDAWGIGYTAYTFHASSDKEAIEEFIRCVHVDRELVTILEW